MPKFKVDVPENVYMTKCGQTKVINDDRSSTLKLWYRLHQKKCDICKKHPYRHRTDNLTQMKSAEDYAEHQKILYHPTYKKIATEKTILLNELMKKIEEDNWIEYGYNINI